MQFDFKTFASILMIVGPGVLLAVPGGAQFVPLVPVIMSGIAEAQQMKGATGPQKKDHVLKLVEAAVTAANTVKPGTIKQPSLAISTASAAIDTVIGTINLVQDAHAALPNVPSAIVVTPAT